MFIVRSVVLNRIIWSRVTMYIQCSNPGTDAIIEIKTDILMVWYIIAYYTISNTLLVLLNLKCGHLNTMWEASYNLSYNLYCSSICSVMISHALLILKYIFLSHVFRYSLLETLCLNFEVDLSQYRYNFWVIDYHSPFVSNVFSQFVFSLDLVL